MSPLSSAIKRKDWEMASLYLLLGLAQTLAAWPPDAVLGLVEMAAGGAPEEPQSEGHGPQAG